MKKPIDLYFAYGSASYKPSCQAIDLETGETLAFVTRDSWEQAEKAALQDARKHLAYGPVPQSKIVEIEVEDSFPENTIKPIELAEVVEKPIGWVAGEIVMKTAP